MKNEHGFSLIELIVHMGLTSILITIMSQVFVAVLGVRVESLNTTGVQQDGRFIMARLAYDIRRAQAIVFPAYGSASSSMTLLIQEGSVLQTNHYSWDGTNLSVTNASSTAQLNSNRTLITDFSVTRIGNSDQNPAGRDTLSTQLNLTGNSQLESGQQSLEMHTSVSQR